VYTGLNTTSRDLQYEDLDWNKGRTTNPAYTELDIRSWRE